MNKPPNKKQLPINERSFKVPLYEMLKSNEGAESALDYLIDESTGGYSLETGLHVAKGVIPSNRLMELALQKGLVTQETISNIEPQVKAIKGDELRAWLSNYMNLRNLRYVYRQIYGTEPWNEGWQIKTNLAPEFTKLLNRIGFPIKTNYGDQELEALFIEYLPALTKALGGHISEDECRKTFYSIFEDFYPEDKTIDRFLSELSSQGGQEPYLILFTVDHPDIGEIIIGFSWGTVISPPSSVEALTERIIQANYTQNPELVDLGESERLKISNALNDFLQANQSNTDSTTIAYCDEIAVIPGARNGKAFRAVFMDLMTQMATISRDLMDEKNIKNATFLFRTLFGAEMNGIANHYLAGYMKPIYLSGAEEDAVRMIFLAGISNHELLDMQIAGLNALLVDNTAKNGRFREMISNMLTGEGVLADP